VLCNKRYQKNEHDEGQQLQGQWIVRTLITRIDAIANAIHAYQNNRDSHEHRRSQNEKITIIALCVTAFFALLTAGATAVSDWFFKGQLDEMQRSAEQQHRDTLAALNTANRAWISSVAPVFFKPAVQDHPVQVVIPHENVGREPAVDIKESVLFDLIDPPKDDDFRNLPAVSETFCTEYPPEMTLAPTFPSKGQNFIVALTAQQNIKWDASLESNTKFLRVRGCISYNTFSQMHYTWFCYVFGPNVTGAPSQRLGAGCNQGNGAN
jgi:hypothetical protein